MRATDPAIEKRGSGMAEVGPVQVRNNPRGWPNIEAQGLRKQHRCPRRRGESFLPQTAKAEVREAFG